MSDKLKRDGAAIILIFIVVAMFAGFVWFDWWLYFHRHPEASWWTYFLR